MRHILCAFLSIYLQTAWAEQTTYIQEIKHKSYLAQSNYSGEIAQVKLDNFLSVPNADLSQTQDLFLAIESMRTFKFNSMTSRWNLGSRYSDLEGLQYWVRELNTEFKTKMPTIDSQFGVSIGRMYFTDLKLDSLWGLGVVEPQFRGDPINPIHQGLTGLSAWMELGDIKFSVFASPVSFPDTGVSFNVNNGQITSNSPWFVNAPTTIAYDGQLVELNYNLEIGSRLDILVNPALLLGVDTNVYGVDLSLRGGLSPSTQFFLEVDPKAVVDNNNNSMIEAIVEPRLVPKTVFSIKAAKDFSFAKVWSEVFTENHSSVEISNPEIYQSEISNNTYYSLGFDSSVNYNNVKVDFGASYLRNLSRNVLNENNTFRFSDYIFANAFETHVQASLYPIKLIFNLNFKYDLDESAFLASPRITYQNENNLQFYTQYDLMGRPANIDPSGFIAQQSGNDRLMVGLNYVF